MRSPATHVRPTSKPTTGDYDVDPESTVVRFRIRHLFGLARVTGTVGVRAAEISIGSSDTDTTVRAVLDAESFGTGNPIRDRAVRSARYLDTQNYPDIEFCASSVRSSDGTHTANGALTVHGVTLPLEVTVLDFTEDLTELTIHARASVDRYAHGVTAGKGLAGRYVRVDISAVARRH